VGGASGSSGALAVTGDPSSLLTTVGFAFIIGGASVLYFARFGEREEKVGGAGAPVPRRGRHAAQDNARRAPRRRKPSPTPVNRHTR
jgi:hypothetical protein